jgi:hypothetical protein
MGAVPKNVRQHVEIRHGRTSLLVKPGNISWHKATINSAKNMKYALLVHETSELGKRAQRPGPPGRRTSLRPAIPGQKKGHFVSASFISGLL